MYVFEGIFLNFQVNFLNSSIRPYIYLGNEESLLKFQNKYDVSIYTE